MSHQPMSRAMLEDCDRLGMLVVDETFDMWTATKSDFEAMVAKDYNHPSVIMYSIGNEIPEAGSPAGAVWGRELAERIRTLDSTRYVTNAVNNMLAVLGELAAQAQRAGRQLDEGAGINTLMSQAGVLMNQIAASELVTSRTAESYAVLDVAGMNYSDSRYAMDRELFPDRIILGTETFPTRIAELWDLVQEHDHVIGDFTWTGWDYLGEAGIGRPQYAGPDAAPGLTGPYPHLLAGAGDIDILGHRRPASYYREIVYGLRSLPYLAVRRPEHHGKTFTGSPWAWSDAIASWTWPGFEGKPIAVEVYAAADEVELLVNGESAGRRAIERFRAEFDITYEPGELVVIAYAEGAETGRDLLRTASGPISLHAEADRPVIAASGGDLAYVTLALADAAGVVHTAADRPITVEAGGDGVLLGFGSAAPVSEERFDAATHTSYEGRALAVVRPTGPGKIRLLASAAKCEPVEVLIAVEGRGAR
ncbi:DUF4982 domain-containing protein [Nonomuraea insulae]|uniref:DUF4982 domain-containing protein n=1 Tax=Nonomuraea insulae TaxID=1616787 RepID=A0ABW1CHS5_9ACTN